jgi:hypothetical protein
VQLPKRSAIKASRRVKDQGDRAVEQKPSPPDRCRASPELPAWPAKTPRLLAGPNTVDDRRSRVGKYRCYRLSATAMIGLFGFRGGPPVRRCRTPHYPPASEKSIGVDAPHAEGLVVGDQRVPFGSKRNLLWCEEIGWLAGAPSGWSATAVAGDCTQDVCTGIKGPNGRVTGH